MISLEGISWYNDGITRRYIREHAEELTEPKKMEPVALAAALTYCTEAKNPFAEELVSRSRSEQTKIKYRTAPYVKMAMEAVEEAAREFGIEIIW